MAQAISAGPAKTIEPIMIQDGRSIRPGIQRAIAATEPSRHRIRPLRETRRGQ